MIYRIKQAIWAISSNFKEVDYTYINKYLDKNEVVLFKQLKRSEKYHCIRVCYHCLRTNSENKLNIDEVVLAKLALLHDIGKIDYGLNLIEKSILVILNKITKGALKNFSNSEDLATFSSIFLSLSSLARPRL